MDEVDQSNDVDLTDKAGEYADDDDDDDERDECDECGDCDCDGEADGEESRDANLALDGDRVLIVIGADRITESSDGPADVIEEIMVVGVLVVPLLVVDVDNDDNGDATHEDDNADGVVGLDMDPHPSPSCCESLLLVLLLLLLLFN